MNVTLSDNIGILYISYSVKKPNATAKMLQRSRNRRHSTRFWWCLFLYYNRFLPLLNM